MPELPEVQTVVNTLAQAGIVGRRIEKTRIRWARTIQEQSPTSFCRRIQGRIICSVERRGKYIVIRLEPDQTLLVHLRMTGRLLVMEKDAPVSKHVHVLLHLDDSRLLQFHDTRKFGRMRLTDKPAAILDRLGIEPLSSRFTAGALSQILTSRNRQIKPLLLDQGIIAGLGNIYTDEALWAAKIHPQRRSATLVEMEIKALHRAIRQVLRKGIQNNGTSLGDGKSNFVSAARQKGRNQLGLKVFRRTSLPCPRCKAPIIRIVVGQRSTHLCPDCQSH